ncbi:MAG TPA: flagellar assembly protein FliW [Candidatus Sumerlaeota bacterium]|nr:MAG: Flagellar assembly factor FliW [candidate division BRC1 bacterium ADurb.BinA292]HOE96383.1 flagellar assembly protein FliW [Candidatus Sumerlaeota bacterium]HOR27271.1 flagellar assembly protein FliW [Candidatus Sumerlaeota bacterium]HPK01138.1 flagellar assembly protein FliW [Candidatus Sumerlaeota bacterium]
MRFHTTRFGEIEFPEEVVMTFPEGILGFPDEQRYILLEHDTDGSPFKWLQSVENPALAFIIVDPLFIDAGYHLEIDLDTARMIGTDAVEGCAIMSIVNVPHDAPIRMTANLKAPLIVNVENRHGRQIVLGNNAYSLSTPIFQHLVEAEPLPAAAVS